jgi:hypothetical protein
MGTPVTNGTGQHENTAVRSEIVLHQRLWEGRGATFYNNAARSGRCRRNIGLVPRNPPYNREPALVLRDSPPCRPIRRSGAASHR